MFRLAVLTMRFLTVFSFIEENNYYKNKQKQLQKNQIMPPGMPSQDLMAYWGTV
jgi:RAT1-interacting protein